MPTPPDTNSFLLLGLAAVAIILIILVGSMVVRYRNLQRDADMVRELQRDE